MRLLAVILALSAPVYAQDPPDRELVRTARALALLEIYLEAFPSPEESGRDEKPATMENSFESLFTLFAGSLETQDAALASELETLLTELEASSTTETEFSGDVQRAKTLLSRAETLLVPDAARTPAFQAALLARLLLNDGGVSESYEAAATGEADAYSLAWAALKHAHALWKTLEPSLEAKVELEQIDRAFGVLDDLIASPEPPARFRDPEDAEAAANDVAFALEAATSATLFARDLSGSIEDVQDQLAAACGAAQAGQTRLALEHAASAHLLYLEEVGDTLSVLAPELGADLSAHLAGPFPEHLRAGRNVGADCGLLRHALTQAQGRVE